MSKSIAQLESRLERLEKELAEVKTTLAAKPGLHGSEGSKMTKMLHGTVHGRTIELAEDLGLADGQEVEVAVRTVTPGLARQPGEGFLRTEGALVDDPYWDAIMEEIYQDRKMDVRREILE